MTHDPNTPQGIAEAALDAHTREIPGYDRQRLVLVDALRRIAALPAPAPPSCGMTLEEVEAWLDDEWAPEGHRERMRGRLRAAFAARASTHTAVPNELLMRAKANRLDELQLRDDLDHLVMIEKSDVIAEIVAANTVVRDLAALLPTKGE